MLRSLAISVLVLAGTSTVAFADVYRFVDEHGGVHYTDQWVPGSELIKSTKPRQASITADSSHSSSATQPKSGVPGDRSAEQLAENHAAQAVKQDVAKTREQQCKEAKDRYDQSIVARRMYKTTKDGEREYVSDEEADALRVKYRTAMDEVCGGSSK
jgi:hypothetical protein